MSSPKHSPTVSILLATYNGEQYLEAQLDSLINQSYPNLTLYICDDNSSDQTYRILQDYAVQYPFISLMQNKEQLGIIKNFEKLLEVCEGDYIAFCDQDDVWYRDKIEKSVYALEKEGNMLPLLFHSDLIVSDENLKVLDNSFFQMRSYSFKDTKQLAVMLGRCGVMGNSMMINKKLKTLVLPFPENLEAHDYWIALVNELFGKRISSLEPLLTYRIHDTNSSNSRKKLYQKQKSLGAVFQRDYKLPFQNISREKVLNELLKRYSLKKSDRKTVECFLDYLEFKKNRLYLLYLIMKYDFLRDNLGYRLRTAWKILWKKR